MKKIITTSLFAFSLFAFGLSASAFVYPGGAPTGGGVNMAPLNVGPFAQIKQGVLAAPFFGSHKVDIKPCDPNSTLVGGGTSCSDIGAVSPYNLFKAGNSRFFLSTDDSGRTSALALMSPVPPFEIFRAGKLGNNIFTGLTVNTNGLMSYNTPSNPPAVGDVLTAINAGGAMEWQTPTGGAALPSGSIHETLRHDGTNWVANNFLFNDGASVNIGNQSPIPGVALNVLGLTAITGDLAVTNGAHFAMQSGNVGVGISGTSTPPFAARKLDVNGSFRVRQNGLTSSMVLSSAPSNDGTVQWTDINTLVTPGATLPSGNAGDTLYLPSTGNSWAVSGLLKNTNQVVEIKRGLIGGSPHLFDARVWQSNGGQKGIFVDNSGNTNNDNLINNGIALFNGNTAFNATTSFNGQVRIPASAGLNKVLTSDALGNATWQTAQGLSNGTVSHSTLRWNGTDWVENPKMLADQNGRVALGISPSLSGSATFKVSGNMEVNAGVGSNVISGSANVLMGALMLPTAGTPGQDKVLTSDNNGFATWEEPASLPDGTFAQTLYWNNTTGWTPNNVLKTYAAFSPKVAINENGTFGSNNTEVLDVWGQVKIRGGAAGQGKALVSLDSDGRAAWGAVQLKQSGTITQVTEGNIVGSGATRSCPATHPEILGGGASCGNQDTNERMERSFPVFNSSSPDGWTVECASPVDRVSIYMICSQ